MSENVEIEKRLAFQKRLGELIEDDENERNQLPGKIGISHNTFSRAANYGIIPTTKMLILIADYFNVSLEYLLDKTKENNFINSEYRQTFYMRIEQLRNEKGLKNDNALATDSNLPRQYFFDWQKNNYLPRLEILDYLADYFKVSMDYLLGRTDYKN